MCEHCQARVQTTLEALDGVQSAVVSHKEGTAVVTLSAPSMHRRCARLWRNKGITSSRLD